MTFAPDPSSNAGNKHRPSVPDRGCITSLEHRSGDPEAREIRIDRSKAAILLESDVVRLGLFPDMPMTTELADQISCHHEYRVAWRSAIQRLTRSARSEQDIRENLVRKGHDESVVEHIIDRLTANGLLDDARFAASAAESIARRTPSSASYIETKLRQHGIEQTEAHHAAHEAAGDPVDAATELARKAMRSLGSCTPETRIRRLHARLARRGFDLDVIEQALRRLDLELPE